MCDFGQAHDHAAFGYLVDAPAVRTVVQEAQRLVAAPISNAERVERLEPAFAALLASDGWLPEPFGAPDERSGMGDGIGQYALFRAEDGSLCLFALVVPPGAMTPVHDHLAWGLVGVYRGRQDETVYRRLDDGRDPEKAALEVARRQTLAPGECYTLLPPDGDIHYVRTVSDEPSVSIHLLANDTACVWRHRFDPESGRVTPFRSGYSNTACPSEPQTTPT
ncbi:MAG TPA: hypothetical protein VNE16_12525 [Vicinamibacterales bacterium]|nr:hypothetical protein [Vicinamibacterales bacterium]